MPHIVKLLMKEFVTHDTARFIMERPAGYRFVPGQATEVAIHTEQWKQEKRPFTFTSLDEDGVLEFTIKRYPEHNGVTNALHQLASGAEWEIGSAWGAITYRKPGVFIAGGAGITPFIAILRRLRDDGALQGNRLIFSNKTARDVILEAEFRDMLGDAFLPTLTRENAPGYRHGRIDESFLRDTVESFEQPFYLCGPPSFVKDIRKILVQLGAQPDGLVIEE